jgi:hypothetical protein
MSGFNKITSEAKFYLPDFIDEITTSIQTGGVPVFRTGYWNELKTINQRIGKVNGTKYPIVYLPMNFSYDYKSFSSDFGVDFQLYLIHSSSQNYSTEDRLDNIVKITLEPIYDLLMTALKKSKWLIKDFEEIDHKKEYLFYDVNQGEEQNQLCDIVEAIHLTFSNLQFKNL